MKKSVKLSYITRVNISSNAAQAIQVRSMSDALYVEMGDNFELISPGVESYRVSFPWEILRPVKNRLLLYSFISWKVFTKVVFEDRDVFTRDILVAFLTILFGGRSTYEAHKEPRSLVSRAFFRILSNRSGFNLIVISNALSSYYIDHFGLDGHKVLTAHDGVFVEDYDRFREIPKKNLRESLNLPLEKKIIVHTGSLYKGRDATLFGAIVSNFDDVLFVQVGGRSEDVEKYRKYYSEFENIKFIPHQGRLKVIEYQMAADLLFYALTKENDLWWCTSPLKLFEYMASGVPILASGIGSVSEILSYKQAIIFDPELEESITSGVQDFLNDRFDLDSMAGKSLAEVRDKYTWKTRAEKILDFIEYHKLRCQA